MLKRPSGQQIAVAWLKTLTELEGIGIATTLPPISNWTTQDFISVGPVLGGIPSGYIMTRVPVVQIDCWAKAPNSDRPAWNRASATAEAIRDATYGSQAHSRLIIPGGFISTELHGVLPTDEPRKVLSDVVAIARTMLTLQFMYTLTGMVSV